MKKAFFILLIAVSVILAACTDPKSSTASPNGSAEPTSIAPSESEANAPKIEIYNAFEVNPASVEDKNKDVYQKPQNGEYISITLKDGASNAEGKGVVITGDRVLINEKGAYMLSGTLTNGQIVVDVPATDDVILYLNGVDITSNNSAPIYVRTADKAVISLMPDSVNTVTDVMSSSDSGNAITAAVFSNPDLVINGTGKLVVHAKANDGITTKDDLKIMEGTVEVHAADDGINGHDSFTMRNGTVNVEAKGDGIKSSQEKAGKGFIYIGGGTLNVDAGADGLDAVTSILIENGNINIRAGGGSGALTPMPGFDFANWGGGNSGNANAAKSAKAIKADYYIDITGGVTVADALESAVHAKGAIHVFGGALLANAGNDAIHTESDFYMIRGIITSTQCEEAVEGATITIDGGVLSADAKDDCLNANGYNDKTNTLAPGNYSHNEGDNKGSIVINGGTFTFAPLGDGIDSNGSIVFNGGKMTMTGPLSIDEGAFDYITTFDLNGGEFICITSSQHVNKPTAAAQAYLTLAGFTGSAGDVVSIQDSKGKELLSVEAKIGYQAVYASSASFVSGDNYRIFVNGREAGSAAAVK